MPTYLYVCEKCGTEFEVFISLKKKESGWRPACPKCASPKTRRKFTAVATIAGSRPPAEGGGCCSTRRG